jgi:hypothetical protein
MYPAGVVQHLKINTKTSRSLECYRSGNHLIPFLGLVTAKMAPARPRRHLLLGAALEC